MAAKVEYLPYVCIQWYLILQQTVTVNMKMFNKAHGISLQSIKWDCTVNVQEQWGFSLEVTISLETIRVTKLTVSASVCIRSKACVSHDSHQFRLNSFTQTAHVPSSVLVQWPLARQFWYIQVHTYKFGVLLGGQRSHPEEHLKGIRVALFSTF